MDTDLILRDLPESEELRKKGEELMQLQSELAEQELTLMSLRTDLAAFERSYLQAVGRLYIELDLGNKRFVELTRGQGIEDHGENIVGYDAYSGSPTSWYMALSVKRAGLDEAFSRNRQLGSPFLG